MRKFDTKVQHLKYKVLREVARQAWNDTLLDNILEIPKKIVPGKTSTMRCCVYKERAILGERVKIAMGGDKENPNVIEVIEIACDECPAAGFEVTDSCRGCLAHRCEDVCKRGAISFDHNHVAHIDKSKCVECGQCAKVCPYSAIVNRKRPCQNACKIKAISINEENAAAIDNSKCTACGACVYQCPFGAIMDKSYILNVIDLITGAPDFVDKAQLDVLGLTETVQTKADSALPERKKEKKITIDVENIANLACLYLTDEDKISYAEDMNSIITFADTITKVDTSDIKAREHLIPISNVFHDDEVIIHNVERDELLAASPTKTDGYITVPRVVEN